MHSEREPWSSWFPAAGIVADEPEHGILFNDSALMLQAAAAGQGLCLARQSIVYDELQSGRNWCGRSDLRRIAVLVLLRLPQGEGRRSRRSPPSASWIVHQLEEHPAARLISFPRKETRP
jgi:DNA-binding transcriptional LysR family regulator